MHGLGALFDESAPVVLRDFQGGDEARFDLAHGQRGAVGSGRQAVFGDGFRSRRAGLRRG